MHTYAKKKLEKSYGQKKISSIHIPEVIKLQAEELIERLKQELYKTEEIRVAILFGSFARGDYSLRHSDIDIMIILNKTKKDPKLEERILKKIIKHNLGKEMSVHTVFQYKKVKEEDKSLMLTIAQEGKVLFAKETLVISDSVLGLKPYFLIKFDTTQQKSAIKNKLQRFLHGYSLQGKRYKGIIDNENVLAAGKGAIIVPEDILKKILFFAQSIGITARQQGKFYR